jgi:DNA-binding winged helix-turn-helix (wHTH) protein
VIATALPADLQRCRIGRFEIRPAQRLVLDNGRAVRLGGRAFDVLAVLLEKAGTVVERSELFERVWPGLAVEPNNLQVQVWALRRLFGAQAIQTVPRRGYRLCLTPQELPYRASYGAAATGGETLRSRLRWQSR